MQPGSATRLRRVEVGAPDELGKHPLGLDGTGLFPNRWESSFPLDRHRPLTLGSPPMPLEHLVSSFVQLPGWLIYLILGCVAFASALIVQWIGGQVI